MKEYRFDELAIGTREGFNIEITDAMMNAFKDITHDINPLHTEMQFAITKGFKDRVVYGLLTSAFYSTLVGMYLPGKFCLLQEISVSFLHSAFVGDRLTIAGEVSYKNEAFRQVEIKASIINQDNTKISKAKIKVGLYE